MRIPLGILALLCLATTLGHAGPVDVKDGRFIAPDGRPIVLRGLNVAQASKAAPYLPKQGKADLAKLPGWGCNCIRYLVLWAAIEPQPGKYDDAYLTAVRERLDWAKDAGLYVVLDMHQDVFGEKYGYCGAPTWACLDGGAPFERKPGEHWAAGYLKPATLAAFDSFWADAPGPDGVGIQERFIRMWRHVVDRLGDHPAVIGYDLLNEPFYGNVLKYPETFAAFVKLQALLPKGTNPMELFSAQRSDEMRRLVADPGRLYSAIDCADPAIRRFETERLMPFYTRIIPQLRQVTPDAIFFLEPHIWASGGAHSFLTREGVGGEGARLAFAPHYYDPGCAPDVPYDGSPARAKEAFRRMQEVATRLNAPVFLGEWGDAESPAATASQYLRDQGKLLRDLGFSHCYWDDSTDASHKPVFAALQESWRGE
jgi:endoglycosylceramidase